MNADLSWDATRWRDADVIAHSRAPHLSAPSPRSAAAAHSIILDHHETWPARSHHAITSGEARELPSLTDTYTDASTYYARPHQRHTPTPGGNQGLQQLETTSPRQTFTSWQSLQRDDQRTCGPRLTDAPLTLHIPERQDMPRIAPAYAARPLETQSHESSHSAHAHPTSLPSFASFQESANRTDEPDEGPEIAPMSSRLSCYQCNRLKPMVQDVAIAAAELDEAVQTHCNRSVTRTLDFPKDSPVRVVEWVLDRLRYARSDLQEAVSRTVPGRNHQQSSYYASGLASRNDSPPNSLKRPANDGTDQPVSKRPRSGSVSEAYTSAIRDDRQAVYDFASKDVNYRPVYSPQPTESLPGSAYPRQHSPSFHARPLRPLPSPSSLAYPPSAATSLPPPTAQSVGSPSNSYQPGSSIHTASTSSVASQHIADLQHQVTLKSLSLQTLQSEYSTLLQKLQREKVKSQTIEKKTNVADQEVNELTGKNEELTEQVQALEKQLEEIEKRREAERAEAAKEKDQWGRMLEMGGRLQAKHAEDRQKLLEDISHLQQRVAYYEEENSLRFEQIKKNLQTRMDSPSRDAAGQSRSTLDSGSDAASKAGGPSAKFLRSDTADSKREVVLLKARIEVLQSALERVTQQNDEVEQHTKTFLEQAQHTRTIITRALKDDCTAPSRDVRAFSKGSSECSTPRANSVRSPKVLPTVMPTSELRAVSKSPRSLEHMNTLVGSTALSAARIAATARAVSPGPAELGFEVIPSTLSPEELIRALGPLPAPSPRTTTGSSFSHYVAHPSSFSSLAKQEISPALATTQGGFRAWAGNAGFPPAVNHFSFAKGKERSPPSSHSSRSSSASRSANSLEQPTFGNLFFQPMSNPPKLPSFQHFTNGASTQRRHSLGLGEASRLSLAKPAPIAPARMMPPPPRPHTSTDFAATPISKA